MTVWRFTNFFEKSLSCRKEKAKSTLTKYKLQGTPYKLAYPQHFFEY